MKCTKNGIKKEGESCTLNNNCIYPNCIKTELELEAEKYAKTLSKFPKWNKHDSSIFIAGATSDAAKEYWYKQFQKEKLEFAIEQLNKLDTVLQSKYERLTNMQQEYLGKMKEGQLASKKSGLRLAKEEIRRDIKELEQKLK